MKGRRLGPKEDLICRPVLFKLSILNLAHMFSSLTSVFFSDCKVTCHKKCCTKVVGDCRVSQEAGSNRLVFGVPLHRLAMDGKVPLVVDRLITTIEMHGLYTEGIYRKSGVRR